MNKIHTISGIVQHGDKRGKTLGFPTANIPLNQEIADGVYASTVIVDGITYKGATFIGSPETFDITDRKAEIYIFEFNKDIYGEEITITLYQKTRDSKKFGSLELLIKQIHEDIAEIKAILTKE